MAGALEAVREVAERHRPNVLLLGNPGLGKTHLGISAMHVFGAQEAIYWRVEAFLRWVRRMIYDEGWSMDAALRCYLEQKFLLVFDEFGRQKRSEFAEETVFAVLDSRAANESPTILIGNVDPEAIDPAIRSRYRVVGCEGVDVRGRL